jgi:indolepyruvate ferredoxin oxidoreductase, beta subunit
VGVVNAVTNVVVAGLGGQGVITASDIIADAAFRSGHDVKKAEVHGMSQRGGSVSTDVRFGELVLSPMVSEGEADYLVVLADDQVEVFRHRLQPGGVLIEPSALGGERLPHPRSLNVALLGVLSAHLEIPEVTWLEAIHAALDPKLHPVNERAFALGRRIGTSPRPGGD